MEDPLAAQLGTHFGRRTTATMTTITGASFGLLGGCLLGILSGTAAGQPVLRAGEESTRARPDTLTAELAVAMPGGTVRDMPLVEESLRVTIAAQHSTTRLSQVFRNDSGGPVEGAYTLRAGQGARVSGFSYWNGEQRIVGEVFERAAAQQIYTRIVNRGRDPGLLVQRGEGSFGFRVFPIAPNERKRVQVSYTRWLPRRDGRVAYRAPVSHPDASIRITIRDPREVSELHSSTHRLTTERVRGALRVRATPRDRPRELSLSYRVQERPFQLQASIHRDRGHDAYFVLSVAAPDLPDEAVAPKDLTLVLDRSGSMAGEPLRQALAAAENIVARLPAHDRVNVIAFDDDVDPLFARPMGASDATRQTAIDFIRRLRGGGGTDLALALERTLAGQHDGERPRVVIFLTDGRSSAAMALDAARADRRDVRIFSIGVGPQVDRSVLSRLAALKRGRFTFIESSQAIEARVGQLYQQIDRPLLVDVSLRVEGADARRVYPRTAPDLFAHDELRFSGRLRGRGQLRFVLEGTLRGERIRRTQRLELPDRSHKPWVAALWASARVDDLLEELSLSGDQTELKDEVVDLSLAYNFVTPYTAFLAIPQSEITPDVRVDLDHVREQKADALRRMVDARAAIVGARSGRVSARRRAAPEAFMASSGPGGMQDDLLTVDLMDTPASGARETAEEVRPAPSAVRAERAGCASCTVGAQADAPHARLGVALGLLLLLARILHRIVRPRGTARRRELTVSSQARAGAFFPPWLGQNVTPSCSPDGQLSRSSSAVRAEKW